MSFLHRSVCGLLLPGILAATDHRFGLPLSGLDNAHEFLNLDLTGTNLVVGHRRQMVVAAVAYGGPERYYIDVAISNGGKETVTLAEDFVRFHKNGTSYPPLDTRKVASDLQEAAAAPPLRASTVAVSKEKAAEQQARLDKAKDDQKAIAAHVKLYAHEKQSLALTPGNMTVYTFAFEPGDREPMPFELCVVVGDDEFKFEYRQ
jgi:hypothetical protein